MNAKLQQIKARSSRLASMGKKGVVLLAAGVIGGYAMAPGSPLSPLLQDADAQQGCSFIVDRTMLGYEQKATAVSASGLEIKTGGFASNGYWALACPK